jgi:hypothetical protein
MSNNTEKIGFEGLETESPKTRVDLFSAMAMELVSQYASECKTANVLPNYPYFEIWMAQNEAIYRHNFVTFPEECHLSYLWSYPGLRVYPYF